MKKKIVLSLVFALLFICVMVFTVGAAEMTQYCDAKLTMVDGTSAVGYFEVTVVNKVPTLQGKVIYKTPDKTGETIDWAKVVVVDMRDNNYVGDGPKKMSNFGKESSLKISALNLEQVYLPDTLVEIPATFMNKWTAIQYVYVPKSVTSVGLNAFAYSSVSAIAFEEGSTLKSIGVGSFRNCEYLTSFTIPEGVETIGNNAFMESSIGGEMKVPNSVKTIGNGAFSGTKLESVSFGDGGVTIGYGVLGHATVNTEYLKKVYISTNTKFADGIDTSKMWYPTTDTTISFYVVSEGNEDTSEFIQKLRQTGTLVFTTIEEIEDGIAPEGFNAIIYKNVNVCDAFNNGAHNQPGEAELIFTNAFTDFYEAKECIACNRFLPAGDSFAPIVSLVGYSTRENGTGFCVEYKIDRTSYEKYKEYHADGMSFGLILSIVGEETETVDVVNVSADGQVTAKDTSKTAVLNVSDTFSGFTFKLSGFGENHSDLNIVLSVFAYDGEKVLYLNDDTPSETLDTIAVGQIIR